MTVGAAPSGTQRIARAFARARETKRLAIVVYLTVGYPDRAATGALVRAALDGGADVLELGVPFSDPLADGATVQRASEVALRQGVTLADCIAEASTVVRERDATVLLMGYTNPFLRYRGGLRGFAADAAQAGAAGTPGAGCDSQSSRTAAETSFVTCPSSGASSTRTVASVPSAPPSTRTL